MLIRLVATTITMLVARINGLLISGLKWVITPVNTTCCYHDYNARRSYKWLFDIRVGYH